jgi:hypothetical protein
MEHEKTDDKNNVKKYAKKSYKIRYKKHGARIVKTSFKIKM